MDFSALLAVQEDCLQVPSVTAGYFARLFYEQVFPDLAALLTPPLGPAPRPTLTLPSFPWWDAQQRHQPSSGDFAHTLPRGRLCSLASRPTAPVPRGFYIGHSDSSL